MTDQNPEATPAPILVSHSGPIRTITLNRAERHNAFDDGLIADLTTAFIEAERDSVTRIVVLDARGKSFSAGADLAWMKRMAAYSADDNRRDAEALAHLMRVIHTCPKPVIAVVQGSAIGGGVGLVAAADIALAAEEALFCLSEVRLGIIPAVISPYVVAAMGARACRRYFLTAERFSAATAAALGLVHEVVPAADLPAARDRVIQALLQGGPGAQAAVKELISAVATRPIGPEMVTDTARRIAEIRVSQEGQEGIGAFLEKRRPSWTQG